MYAAACAGEDSCWIFYSWICFLFFIMWVWFCVRSSLNQKAYKEFCDVLAVLKKRHEIVPDLISIFKVYAPNENDLFKNITKAFDLAKKRRGAAKRAKAETALTNSIRWLFAVSERYPDIKQDEKFTKLKSELLELEEKISKEAAEYNEAVLQFHKFPYKFFVDEYMFMSGELFDPKEKEKIGI